MGGGILFLAILFFLLFFVRNNSPQELLHSPAAISFIVIALLVEVWLLYSLGQALRERRSKGRLQQPDQARHRRPHRR
ncbi:MAG: hypothetical protein D6736_08285 [Nitrospinota bacterium]|nr:MAG: hypothetical protein D6736_08285 [Nitrospinota bacterium]